jgi:hypothetical protein
MPFLTISAASGETGLHFIGRMIIWLFLATITAIADSVNCVYNSKALFIPASSRILLIVAGLTMK